MAFTYTVTDLIASIKVRCLVPISQITFTTDDILRFANEEIELKMVPNILRVKEEFYVRNKSVTIESGVTEYEIPYRAIGSKLRNLFFKSGGNMFPATRLEPELVPYYEGSGNGANNTAFYLRGNDIVLINGTSAGQVVFSYYLKPNKMVQTTRVGIISSIDRVGNGTIGSVTVSNTTFPTNFTADSEVDFLQAKPNFGTYNFDVAITSVNPTTKQIFVLLSDIPTKLKVGDHIANAGECITPQVPSELQSMLAQTVACRLLEAMGDKDNLVMAEKKLAEMERNLFAVIDSRTEGTPQKINNIRGLLSSSKIGGRRYGGNKS